MIEKISSGLHVTVIGCVFHHDAAFGVGTIHGLISILLEWDTFASADSSVGRNQHFSAAINNPILKGFRAESTKHHRMYRANSGAG